MLHDELNVLGLEPRVINLLVIFLFFLLLLVFNRLALALAMIMVVIMTGVIVRGSFSLREIRCSIGCNLRVQVFNLGFTKDAGTGSVPVLCN